MYINEKLKGNRFKEVRIPTKMEYFQTRGYGQDTGMYDSSNKLTPGRKTDILAEMQDWDKENIPGRE